LHRKYWENKEAAEAVAVAEAAEQLRGLEDEKDQLLVKHTHT
jgi:hypothetical protein